MDIEKIIKEMSLEDKCALLSGEQSFASREFKKYGIPRVSFSDGPHGLRKQSEGANHLGIGGSVKATCFPTAATVAASWDPSLGEEIGKALGEEAAVQKVDMILGPGLNMKRSPLCGRNFEYFSEDPYLAGKMAAGYIRGIQANGLSACPKHFAVNNQELQRMASDSVADERTLREIYLTGFEIAVKEGHPKAIMSSYNLINETYANENPHLLQDILRNEWGFDGCVVTDWGGSNDHTEGVRAGSTIEMPAPGTDSVLGLIRSVKKGLLPENAVDDRVREFLKLAFQTHPTTENAPDSFDEKKHHELAKRAAAESMVLLKNEDNILPLGMSEKVALIGDFAKTPRYQGAGSSLVNPTKLDTLAEVIKTYGINCIGYAQGYRRQGQKDTTLRDEALELAKKADVVLYCMGLDEMKESEGLDRPNMRISDNQVSLLHALTAAGCRVAVILSAGSAVEMPWIAACKGLLYACLGGQAGASAICDVLTGAVNPGGKLAETYAWRYEDTPAVAHFPGHHKTAEYREGIYIGYRYYDTAGIPVTFPFGFGLSYTEFAYSGMKVNGNEVSCDVTNTGNRDGAETVQLYISRIKDDSSHIFRPSKELKGFAKVFVRAGETKRVQITLDDKAFRYFNVKTDSFETENGNYEVMLAASSADVRLRETVSIKGAAMVPDPYDGLSLPDYDTGHVQDVPAEEFAALLGHAIPDSRIHGRITANITFGQLIHGRSPIGWIVWLVLTLMMKISEKRGKPDLNLLFIYNMPLRALAKMTNGAFSMEMVNGFVMEINGFWIIGLVRMLAGAVSNAVSSAAFKNRVSR